MIRSIYNANSFQMIKEFADNSFDTIITDVPYDFTRDMKEFMHEQFMRVVKDTVIVFSPPENQWILPANQYLFWIKPISTKNTSKSYSRFVEIMFVYHKTKNPTWNSDRHWSQYTNVFMDLVDNSANHPYRKPPSLIERLIRNHTNEWDHVLDPFCGSGVVLEVCRKLNRNYTGVEINNQRYNYTKELLEKYG